MAAGVDPSNLRPDQALVFWLNGFNPDPTQPFLGLATLTRAQRTPPFFDFDASRLVKLSATTNALSYVPAGVKDFAPYVYFDSGFYGYGNPSYSAPIAWWCNSISCPGVTSDAGYAMAYVKDNINPGVFDSPFANPQGDEWVNPDSFQIISSGLDGVFGNNGAGVTGNPNVINTLRLYPTGNPYNAAAVVAPGSKPTGYDMYGADDDNITNFCERARLGDAKP